MLKFDTFAQLIDYCQVCPVCKANRQFYLDAEDGKVKIIRFNFYQRTLSIDMQFRAGSYHEAIIIDLKRNTIQSTAWHDPTFIYFNVSCQSCNATSLSTGDIELNFDTKKVSNLVVEYEERLVRTPKINHLVEYQHTIDTMVIRMGFVGANKSSVFDWQHDYQLPIDTQFDFSDPTKLAERLQTLSLYS